MAGPTMKQLLKTGFGLGLGVTAAHLLYMLVGIVLLVWGTALLKKAREGQGSLAAAYFVLILGVVFGLGLGGGFVLQNIYNNA